MRRKFHYFNNTILNALKLWIVFDNPEQNCWRRSKHYPSGQNDNNKTDFFELLIQFLFLQQIKTGPHSNFIKEVHLDSTKLAILSLEK